MEYRDMSPIQFVQEVKDYVLTEGESNLFFVKKGELKIADFREEAIVSMGCITPEFKSMEWHEALRKMRNDSESINPTPIRQVVYNKWLDKHRFESNPEHKKMSPIQLAKWEAFKNEAAYKEVQKLLELF